MVRATLKMAPAIYWIRSYFALYKVYDVFI